MVRAYYSVCAQFVKRRMPEAFLLPALGLNWFIENGACRLLRDDCGSAANLFHKALHGIARLCAALHPVFDAGKVDIGVQASLPRVVVPDDLDEFTIAWAALISDHNFVVRSIFSAFAAKSDDDHKYLCFG